MTTANERKEWRAKGIEVIKAKRVKGGDLLLMEDHGVRKAVEVITILHNGPYMRLLHDLDPLGTLVQETDEVMRLLPNVHWLGDFRKQS